MSKQIVGICKRSFSIKIYNNNYSNMYKTPFKTYNTYYAKYLPINSANTIFSFLPIPFKRLLYRFVYNRITYYKLITN